MGLLGSLMVNLGLNTANFTAGLGSAVGQVKKATGTIKNSLNSLANASDPFKNKTTRNFKDVSRIAQGILISQAFYRTTNAIQGTIGAMAEFSSQTEQAGVSFAILMKDLPKSERFMATLEDFAARTPFTFQQAADNARKLLAYSFKAENLGPIMDTLSDASNASGDSETFNRVAKALGQIKTKGRLASQEIIQLTETGIPAFEILRQKLHLTAEQMANIGHLRIPADVSINALLEGMQERYGGAANILADTVKGMLGTIQDNTLIVGRRAFSPLYDGFKKTIEKIRDASDRWRETIRDSGTGGLMHSLIPESMFGKVQIFVAHLKILRHSIMLLAQALWPFVKALGDGLLMALNVVTPILNLFLMTLGVLGGLLSSSSARVRMLVGAFMGLVIAALVTKLLLNFGLVLRSLFIVKTVATMVLWLAKAIRVLSLAMISNPWIALIGVAAGALLYFGLTSQRVAGWISGMGTSISKIFGMDPSKVFTPKMATNNKIADEFNEKLGVSKESLDKMAESAKKAGKEAKNALMSFDEVFNITDPTDGTDSSALDDLNTPTIPEIGIPDLEFPDVTDGIKDWVNRFRDTIIAKLKNTLLGAGIGAAIGAVIGGIIGGPGGAIIGAKIGLLAGGIAGWFWDALSDEIKMAAKTGGVGAGIGFVLGTLIAGPGGGLVLAGIGTLVGGIIGYFWQTLSVRIKNTIKATAIGTGIGGVIGGLFFGPVGTIIGAGIGSLVAGIVTYFWGHISKKVIDAAKAGGMAGGIGAAIGFAFGGPGGAVLGAGIGLLVGSIVKYFWAELKVQIADIGLASMAGMGIGAVIGGMFLGPGGIVIGAAIGGLVTEIIKKFWSGMKTSIADLNLASLAGMGIGAVIGFMFLGPGGVAIGGALGILITNIVSKFWSGMKTTVADTTKASLVGIGIGAVIGFMFLGPGGLAIGGAIGALVSGIIESFWSKMTSQMRDATRGAGIGASIGAVIGGVFGGPGGAIIGAAIGTLVGSIVGYFWDKFRTAFSIRKTNILNFKPTSTYAQQNAGTFTFDSEYSQYGHARGGVFNKAHLAQFAEGNKAEAIIPLENNTAMQPFVDAVAGGLSSSLTSMLSQITAAQQGGSGGDKPIMYVGTLIADDRSLKELERKMRVIRLGEDNRR